MRGGLTITLAAVLAIAGGAASAQDLAVDASAPVAEPETGYLQLGSVRSPGGAVFGANSRYLTLDGKPWLPVMGEMHYSRVPASEWDASLARIKASGVDIVATYLFWNHHQAVEGPIDWSGDRDLKRFVATAARHGLKVWLRLGPWVHGESRYGGLPDWVVASVPTRGSDPTYMKHVERFWASAAEQVRGQMWKDGGPVIGTQLENEYNLTGPLQGREHIADLKAMAIRLGFDTPYYTVTGWDGAIYPKGEVMPLFGSYPDEPWSTSTTKLPPKETYAFRFDSRVSGDLGAQTQASRAGDGDGDMARTPFLGAEYGGGVPIMYRRRPLISGDDIGAMLPVQVGSGVNLYGYYMYHGGRNPTEPTTLHEQTSLGGYNDVPIVEYDFQAPFGQYGQANATLGPIRPFHYFLNSWGTSLAPMTVRRPAVIPADPADLATPRFSVRSKGDGAFVFYNGHVRQYDMAAQRGVRFAVKLPGGTVNVPDRPIDIPKGSYFVWPVNLDTDAARIRWATVQPVTRIETTDGPVTVFQALPGIEAQFLIDGARVETATGRTAAVAGGTRIAAIRPGTDAVLTLTGTGGKRERYLVLTQEQARRLVPLRNAAGRIDRIVLSDDELTPSADGFALVSRGNPQFDFALFPSARPSAAGNRLATSRDGVFTRYRASLPARKIAVKAVKLREAGKAAPIAIGGPANAAMEPLLERFGASAARWQLTVAPDALEGVEDVTLAFDWQGDVGRMFSGSTLIEDRYFDGRAWTMKLGRFRQMLGAPLVLAVSPLRGDAPVYIDDALRPKLAKDAQVATIGDVRAVADYRLTVRIGE